VEPECVASSLILSRERYDHGSKGAFAERGSSDVQLAHYQACDALGLSTAEQVSIGQEVGNRIQGTLSA
jgi:hypothetical protein